jgi:hypothetical protein
MIMKKELTRRKMKIKIKTSRKMLENLEIQKNVLNDQIGFLEAYERRRVTSVAEEKLDIHSATEVAIK